MITPTSTPIVENSRLYVNAGLGNEPRPKAVARLPQSLEGAVEQ